MANETLCHLNLLHLRIFIETFHCGGRFTVSEHESKRKGFYLPPLKLPVGNLFSRVCLLFCLQWTPVKGPSLILSIRNPAPASPRSPPPNPHPLDFNLDLTAQRSYPFRLVHYRLSANVQLAFNWNAFLFFDVGVGKNLSVKDIALSFTLQEEDTLLTDLQIILLWRKLFENYLKLSQNFLFKV